MAVSASFIIGYGLYLFDPRLTVVYVGVVLLVLARFIAAAEKED